MKWVAKQEHTGVDGEANAVRGVAEAIAIGVRVLNDVNSKLPCNGCSESRCLW